LARRRSRLSLPSHALSSSAPALEAPAAVVEAATSHHDTDRPARFLSWPWALALGLAMLTPATMLAIQSLRSETMTVDEPVHLAAGVAYWKTGTFRCYRMSPPLIRLTMAAPVVFLGRPVVEGLFNAPGWATRQAELAHKFAALNAPAFFDLATWARLTTLPFFILGGLVVFFWAGRLFGTAGAVVGLILWAFTPNVLAHARLATTDIPTAALMIATTYMFVRSIEHPSIGRALGVGLALGLALAAKFTTLLLLVLWPILWMIHRVVKRGGSHFTGRGWLAPLGRGALTLAVALGVLNTLFLFEGTGQRLGSFEFMSESLTRPRGVADRKYGPPAIASIPDLQVMYDRRINRFKGTTLESLPVPLPREFVLGFDEQKFETEGIPRAYLDPTATEADGVIGYPVYLDGELRDTGWSDYYVRALLYKTPEPTLLLAVVALIAPLASPSLRCRLPWGDLAVLAVVPAAVLVSMTFGTNINIGVRYILPLVPFACVLMGSLGLWWSLQTTWLGRVGVGGVLALGLGGTIAESLMIHPHYLAYFNRLSGGPDRGAERLIDSNLDWGQDLLNLARWIEKHAAGDPVGLAYFGQIHPNLLNQRPDATTPTRWFLPPGRPGALTPLAASHPVPEGPVQPGWYAVSASLVKGLPWRVYDSAGSPVYPSHAAGARAFSYFDAMTPIDKIGYSIWIYRLDQAAADRLEQARVQPPPSADAATD